VRGVYVQGVDDARVASADTRGNVVIVPAGMRRVRVTRGNGIALKVKSKTWDFDFLCEKGHTYEFVPAGPFDGRLKVTDVTIGESLIVSNNDLAEPW
jgi:hypothetical protein